jgi:putative membrane protein
MNSTRINQAPKSLLFFSIAYLGLIAFSLWHPKSIAVWIAEMIPALAIFVLIWVLSRTFRFSTVSYVLMFIWLSLHTIGAKYTFAEVPFDWFNQLLDSERNHYDRVAHYSIGFYAFPIAEYLIRKQYCNTMLATLVGLFSIMSLAASYEIIEWWYAVLAGGDAGVAFLGSQGDIWDAQKDMLCDTLGAVSALLLIPFAINADFWLSSLAKTNTR